jgi:hypothetical protein
MATEAQVTANRLNAQKSTGPRTPEGKAVVAQNAVKHGLLAQEVVIKGEDRDQFARWREGMLAELAPAGDVESELAERIVGLFWRLRRAERLQGAAFGTFPEEKTKWTWSEEDKQYVVLQTDKPGRPGPGSAEEARAVDRRIVQDFSEGRIFDHLLIHEQRIERSLYRTMAELRGLRTERRKEGEKVRRSEERSVLPSSVPTFSPSSAPDGAATNVPQAEDEFCETKPIGIGAGEVQSLCSTDVTSNPAPSGPGETKPIGGRRYAVIDGRLAEQLRQTNPIATGGETGQVLGGAGVTDDSSADRLEETKPTGAGRETETRPQDTVLSADCQV